MILTYGYSNTIVKAASRVRGDRLGSLYTLCESQKTISTRKLKLLLDELAEGEKLDGIHFRTLADQMTDKST